MEALPLGPVWSLMTGVKVSSTLGRGTVGDDPSVIRACANVSPFPAGNPPATGTGTLLITLEDVNDNAPFIYPTVAEVCDDAKNLSVVILGATDKDLHPNTDPFKFEIHKQSVPDKVWKISKINSKSS